VGDEGKVVRVTRADAGWSVTYAGGEAESFPSRAAALLAAQEAAMRTGAAVVVETRSSDR
jgi:hypothetical protein